MQHLKALLLIAFLAITICPTISVAQVRWQTIIDQEAGFKISFPGKPAYRESTAPETGQPLETYSFYYNGHTLQVDFQPLVPPPRTALEVNQVLSGSSDAFAKNAGTLLRQEKLPGGGRQFDNLVKTKSGTLHLRSRLYIHRGKLFALSCGSYDAKGINEQIAERFFSSFSFTESLSSQRVESGNNSLEQASERVERRDRWYTHRNPDGDFVVKFPGKPEYLQLKVQGTNDTLHRYHLFFGENYFMVSYYDTNITMGTSEQIMQEAADNYLAAYPNWRLIGKTQLSDDGYQVELQGVVEGFPIHMQTRFYLRGTRIYFVTTHTKNLSGPNKNDISRFFSSFYLVKFAQ